MMKYLKLIFFLICVSLFTFEIQAQQTDRYREAQHLIDNSEFKKAKGILEKNLKIFPTDAELYYLYGYVLIQLVDEASIFKKLSYAKKGRDQYIRAIELDPKLIKAYKELSDYYLYSPSIAGGNTVKALEIIEEIKHHDIFLYHLYKGDFYMAEEDYKKANEIFMNTVNLYPDSLAPLAKTGLSFRRLEDYRMSAEYFERAIQLDSTYYLGYFHIALAGLLGEFDLDESISNFEKYIEQAGSVDQRYLDHAFYRIGMIYELKNDASTAKQYYERSLEINPDFERAKEALKKL